MAKKEKPEQPEIPAHVHIWDILDVQIPDKTLYHPRLNQTAITVVLIRCKECDLPQTIELQGTWTLEQILKNHARIMRKEAADELQQQPEG
jgi:hypothetical protein